MINRALAPLVPLELAYAVAAPAARIAYRLWRSKAEAARRNYAAILGCPPDDPRAEALARSAFRHFGLYVVEMLDVQGWDNDTLLDRMEVYGEENFAAAESHEKGIIFVSAHMGSAEAAAGLAVLRGYSVTAVSEELRPQFLMDWAVAARRRMGVRLVTEESAGLNLVRALRRRETVAMVLDAGFHRGGGIELKFFGRPTIFPDAAARLARISGAPVVFAVAVRLPGGRFRAFVEPPLMSDRSRPAQADARRITQSLAQTLERYVRRYPAQWYAFREVWPERPATRPAG